MLVFLPTPLGKQILTSDTLVFLPPPLGEGRGGGWLFGKSVSP